MRRLFPPLFLVLALVFIGASPVGAGWQEVCEETTTGTTAASRQLGFPQRTVRTCRREYVPDGIVQSPSDTVCMTALEITDLCAQALVLMPETCPEPKVVHIPLIVSPMIVAHCQKLGVEEKKCRDLANASIEGIKRLHPDAPILMR